MDKVAPADKDRHSYVHKGQTVYQWEQTLTCVRSPSIASRFDLIYTSYTAAKLIFTLVYRQVSVQSN